VQLWSAMGVGKPPARYELCVWVIVCGGGVGGVGRG
jgi:hypothetical protein